MSQSELISVLMERFALSSEEVALAMRQAGRHQGSLHMVLWQLGFITLEQLDVLFGWLIAGDRQHFDSELIAIPVEN